jgi:predicted dehydrogenase
MTNIALVGTPDRIRFEHAIISGLAEATIRTVFSDRDVPAELDELARPSVEEAAADVDVVVLCATPEEHKGLVRSTGGLSVPLFCRAPMAPNRRDADDILTSLRDREASFGVGFPARFHPAFLRLWELLRLGEEEAEELWLARTGLLDPNPANSHDLFSVLNGDVDLLRLLGGPVNEVTAISNADPDADGSAEPTGISAILRLDSGSLGNLRVSIGAEALSWTLGFRNQERTAEATVDRDRPDGVLLNSSAGSLEATRLEKDGWNLANREMYRRAFEDLENGEEPGVNAFAAYGILRVADAVLSSARRGSLVSL